MRLPWLSLSFVVVASCPLFGCPYFKFCAVVCEAAVAVPISSSRVLYGCSFWCFCSSVRLFVLVFLQPVSKRIPLMTLTNKGRFVRLPRLSLLRFLLACSLLLPFVPSFWCLVVGER